jgi:hypothetical protein
VLGELRRDLRGCNGRIEACGGNGCIWLYIVDILV